MVKRFTDVVSQLTGARHRPARTAVCVLYTRRAEPVLGLNDVGGSSDSSQAALRRSHGREVVMDTDLVIKAQRGDREAFAILASEIADRFVAVSRRILRDVDLAEDAAQQAW